MSDEAIQLTNNDASSFKSYAVHKGYWKDAYINNFSPVLSKSSSQPFANEHKPPEMSRGYFARVSSMRTVIHKFLDSHTVNSKPQCQIISIGAGYDTMYFNLTDEGKLPLKYIEMDFMRVISSKIRLIKSKKALFEKIQLESKPIDIVVSDIIDEAPSLFKLPTSTVPSAMSSIQPGKDLITPQYSLVSVDLRNLDELDKKLKECQLNRDLPTLIIAECVLIYMSSDYSNALLCHLSKSFRQCCFLNYEQVNLSDKFGEIMLYNMQQRSCKLAGSDACSSIESQITRFKTNGFTSCQCITLTDFYLTKLDKKERQRIESLEFLDENELLIQLLDHYCICIAANYDVTKIMFN